MAAEAAGLEIPIDPCLSPQQTAKIKADRVANRAFQTGLHNGVTKAFPLAEYQADMSSPPYNQFWRNDKYKLTIGFMRYNSAEAAKLNILSVLPGVKSITYEFGDEGYFWEDGRISFRRDKVTIFISVSPLKPVPPDAFEWRNPEAAQLARRLAQIVLDQLAKE